MKKLLHLFGLGLLTVAVTACDKNEPIVNPDTSDTNRLKFTIPGAGGAIKTYSGVTVPGNGFEKTITDVAVYLFDYAPDGNGLLRVAERFDNLTCVDQQIIIDMEVDASLTGEYVAYFIANNAGGTFLDESDPYGDGVAVAIGATTETWFQNMPAKPFRNVPTDSFLITGSYTKPFVAEGEHYVVLRNRVARFDLVNKYHGLTITKITARAAADRTSVFGDATRDPGVQPIAPDDVTVFPIWKDYENDGEVAGQISESVFFLHPTEIPNTTKIYIEGYTGTQGVDAETFVYEVDSEPIDILANYRYILTVANDNNPVALELAGQWDMDENAITANAYALQMIRPVTGTSPINRTTFVVGLQGQCRFYFQTANPSGISYEFIPVTGDPAFFTEYDTDDFSISTYQTTQTISYATPTNYYMTELVFSHAVPADGKSFVSILRVTDGSGAKIDVVLYRYSDTFPTDYYPGTTMSGVKVGDVFWAPVNAGALSPKEQGVYAQWNKPTGFRGSATTDIVNGPLAYDVFIHSDNSSMLYNQPFIVNRTNDGKGDWLIDGDPYTASRNTIWYDAAQIASTATNQAYNPCPVGWEIPSAAHFQKLTDAFTNGKFTTNGTSITFEGDDGTSSLTLPLVGYLDHTNGKLYGNGSLGRYWSTASTVDQAVALSIGLAGVSLDICPRAMGLSLRCVKQ